MSATPKTPRRKPARLERHGAMTNRDLMWHAIRLLHASGSAFSVAEIMVLATHWRAPEGATVAPLDEATVATYLDSLEKGDYLVRVHSASSYRCMRAYQMNRDVGVHAPHLDKNGKPTSDNPARDQMWRAMKTMKASFDWRELAQAASTEACVVSDHEAKFYCAQLERAGYLTVDVRGKRHAFNRYRFVRARNTGPRAPIVGRDLTVMDGNIGVVMAEGKKAAGKMPAIPGGAQC